MNNNKKITWDEVRKSLELTPEEEALVQLEMDIIQATIDARKKNSLTQRELSKKSGLKQSVIARIESRARSPKVETLIKMLIPMGYTLRVMPIDKNFMKNK